MEDRELVRNLRKSVEVLKRLDINELKSVLRKVANREEFKRGKYEWFTPYATVLIQGDEIHIVVPANFLCTGLRADDEYYIAEFYLKDYKEVDWKEAIKDTIANIKEEIEDLIKQNPKLGELPAPKVSLRYVVEDATKILDDLDSIGVRFGDLGELSAHDLRGILKSKEALENNEIDLSEFILQKGLPPAGWYYDIYVYDGKLHATDCITTGTSIDYAVDEYVIYTVDNRDGELDPFAFYTIGDTWVLSEEIVEKYTKLHPELKEEYEDDADLQSVIWEEYMTDDEKEAEWGKAFEYIFTGDEGMYDELREAEASAQEYFSVLANVLTSHYPVVATIEGHLLTTQSEIR